LTYPTESVLCSSRRFLWCLCPVGTPGWSALPTGQTANQWLHPRSSWGGERSRGVLYVELRASWRASLTHSISLMAGGFNTGYRPTGSFKAAYYGKALHCQSVRNARRHRRIRAIRRPSVKSRSRSPCLDS